MASIKNLVNFAAKFFKMGKDKKKAKVKPTVKSKSKPAAKKPSKPAAKKATKPVAKKAAKPAKKAVAKAKPVKKAKPVAKKTAKPVAKKATKKAAKPVAKKVVKKAAKPAAKKTVKPVVKKAVEKKVVAAKPIAKKEVKQVKPVVKAAPKAATPVNKQMKSKATPANVQSKPVYNTQPAPIVQTKVNNAPKMRYSDEDLKDFKDLIDGKLASAREELKNLKEALENHTDSQAGNKAWNMEEGTDTSEMEYLMNQISRQHQYIRNLELALVRIENKTYGICRVSGNLIPKERLRVVPHATMSLEAKMNRKSVEESPAAGAAAPPADFSEGFEE